MAEFLDILFSLPTALFTWPLMVIVLYWVVALTGLFDLGVLEGADGALDGALDGAVDGMLDGAVDGAVDAAAGALDGADAIGDAMPDGLEIGEGFFHRFSFGGLPRTFVFSLMIGFGWLFSLLGSLYVPGFQESANRGLLIASGLAAVSFALAFVATAVAVQPLRKAIHAGQGTKRQELVGQTCVIKTQRVDQRFGQAEIAGGSLIQVRSRDAETRFQYGAKAVIFQYDPAQETFLVAPLDEPLT